VLNGGKLRDRGTYPVGDIVNSSPFYVKELDTVFVGGNDGMLHAMNALGAEQFAFVPAEAMPNLKALADVAYAHRYYVDGDITVSSRSAATNNHNYLRAAGRGGKGLFALDVTDPTTFRPPAACGSTPRRAGPRRPVSDLGYMIGRPLFVKMNNGKSALVVGNGYNSTNGHSVLYIFLDADGSLSSVKKIDTGASGDNGFLRRRLRHRWQRDGRRHLCRRPEGQCLEVRRFQQQRHGLGCGLFRQSAVRGKDSSNNVQPITAPMAVAKDTVADDPNYGKVFLFFGTGSYFQSVILPATQCRAGMGLSTRPRSRSICPAFAGIRRRGLSRKTVRTFSTATAGDMTACRAGTSTSQQHPAW
jgi:type IV pilus assembly protein PilY1